MEYALAAIVLGVLGYAVWTTTKIVTLSAQVAEWRTHAERSDLEAKRLQGRVNALLKQIRAGAETRADIGHLSGDSSGPYRVLPPTDEGGDSTPGSASRTDVSDPPEGPGA